MRSKRWWLIGAALVVALTGFAFVFLPGDDELPGGSGDTVALAESGTGDGVATARPVHRYTRPAAIQTTVPDTIGYPERSAIYALEDGGFRVRVMERDVAAVAEEGIVIQQLPRGGVTRRVGWTITIVVGRRP